MAQLSIWLWDLGLHSQMNFPEMEQCWTIHCLLTLLSHRRLSFHTVLQKWDSPYPKWWRVLTKLFILLKSQLSDRNKTKNYPWVTMYNWRRVQCQQTHAMDSASSCWSDSSFQTCSVQDGTIFCEIHHHQWKQCQTLFLGAPKSLQMVTAAMKLKDAYSLEGKLWPT